MVHTDSNRTWITHQGPLNQALLVCLPADWGHWKGSTLSHLLSRDWGRFGAWFLDLGGRVALLIPHGKDGGFVDHGQVGSQSAVQAAADVLGWRCRVR